MDIQNNPLVFVILWEYVAFDKMPLDPELRRVGARPGAPRAGRLATDHEDLSHAVPRWRPTSPEEHHASWFREHV